MIQSRNTKPKYGFRKVKYIAGLASAVLASVSIGTAKPQTVHADTNTNNLQDNRATGEKAAEEELDHIPDNPNSKSQAPRQKQTSQKRTVHIIDDSTQQDLKQEKPVKNAITKNNNTTNVNKKQIAAKLATPKITDKDYLPNNPKVAPAKTVSHVDNSTIDNKTVQNRQSQPKVAVANVSSTQAVQNRAETSTVRQSSVQTSTVNRLNVNKQRNNQISANLKVANVNATANQGVHYTNELTADEYNDWSKISDQRLEDMTFATKLWREDPNRYYYSEAPGNSTTYVPFPDYETYSGSNGSDVVYLKGSQLVSYGVSLNDLRESAIHSYKQDILHDYSDGRLYRAPYAESSDNCKFDWGYVLTPRYVSNCAQILQNLAKNVKFTSSTDPDLYNLQGKDFRADSAYDTYADAYDGYTYGLSFEIANDNQYNYSKPTAYPDTTIEQSSSSAQPSVQYNPTRVTNPNDNQVIVHYVSANGKSTDIPDQTIDLTKSGQGNYNIPNGYALSDPHYTVSEATHNASFTNALTGDEYNNWTKIPDDRLKNMTFAVQLFVLSDDETGWNRWDQYYLPDPDRNPNCTKSAIVYLKGSQLLADGFTTNDLRQSAEFSYIYDVLPTFINSDADVLNETNSYRSLNKYYGPVGVSYDGYEESDSEGMTEEPGNGYDYYYGYVMEPKYKSNSQQILQNLANNVTFKDMYSPDTGTVNGVFDLKSKLSDPNYRFAVVFSTADPEAMGSTYNYNMPVHDGYTFQDNSGQVKSVTGNVVNIVVTKVTTPSIAQIPVCFVDDDNNEKVIGNDTILGVPDNDLVVNPINDLHIPANYVPINFDKFDYGIVQDKNNKTITIHVKHKIIGNAQDYQENAHNERDYLIDKIKSHHIKDLIDGLPDDSNVNTTASNKPVSITNPAVVQNNADYNETLSSLGSNTNLGDLGVYDVSPDSVKSNIQSQVQSQLAIGDASLTNFNMNKDANGNLTASFGIYSDTAKRRNWWTNVKVNNTVVHGIQWRTNVYTASDGNLHEASTGKPIVYSVGIHKLPGAVIHNPAGNKVHVHYVDSNGKAVGGDYLIDTTKNGDGQYKLPNGYQTLNGNTSYNVAYATHNVHHNAVTHTETIQHGHWEQGYTSYNSDGSAQNFFGDGSDAVGHNEWGSAFDGDTSEPITVSTTPTQIWVSDGPDTTETITDKPAYDETVVDATFTDKSGNVKSVTGNVVNIVVTKLTNIGDSNTDLDQWSSNISIVHDPDQAYIANYNDEADIDNKLSQINNDYTKQQNDIINQLNDWYNKVKDYNAKRNDAQAPKLELHYHNDNLHLTKTSTFQVIEKMPHPIVDPNKYGNDQVILKTTITAGKDIARDMVTGETKQTKFLGKYTSGTVEKGHTDGVDQTVIWGSDVELPGYELDPFYAETKEQYDAPNNPTSQGAVLSVSDSDNTIHFNYLVGRNYNDANGVEMSDFPDDQTWYVTMHPLQQHINIVYVDNDTNETVKTTPLQGSTDEQINLTYDAPVNYTIAPDQDLPTNYLFTAGDNSDIDVLLNHAIKPTTQTHTAKRIFKLQFNGQDIMHDYVQTGTITRTSNQDLITGDTDDGDYSQAKWDEVTKDALAKLYEQYGYQTNGHDFTLDGKEFDTIDDVEIDPDTQDETHIINVVPTQANRSINYIDIATNNTVASDSVNGVANAVIKYTPNVPYGFELLTPQDSYSIPILGDDTPFDIYVKSSIIHIDHTKPHHEGELIYDDTQPNMVYPNNVDYDDLNQTITRTINIYQPDSVINQIVQKVVLYRDADYDLAHHTTKYTPWQANGPSSWDSYTAPDFDGYTPDLGHISEATPLPDSQDVTINIHYKKTGSEVLLAYNDTDESGTEVARYNEGGDPNSTIHIDWLNHMTQDMPGYEIVPGQVINGQNLDDLLNAYKSGNIDGSKLAYTLSDVNNPIIIQIRHKISDISDTDPNAKANTQRTLTVVDPMGNEHTIVEYVNFKRTAKLDHATGVVSYGNWYVAGGFVKGAKLDSTGDHLIITSNNDKYEITASKDSTYVMPAIEVPYYNGYTAASNIIDNKGNQIDVNENNTSGFLPSVAINSDSPNRSYIVTYHVDAQGYKAETSRIHEANATINRDRDLLFNNEKVGVKSSFSMPIFKLNALNDANNLANTTNTLSKANNLFKARASYRYVPHFSPTTVKVSTYVPHFAPTVIKAYQSIPTFGAKLRKANTVNPTLLGFKQSIQVQKPPDLATLGLMTTMLGILSR